MTTLGLRRREASAPRRPHRYLRAFWHRAYEENITGLAAMVAYNLVLALFPFALLVLFIFGRILQSQDVETSVLNDLQRLFPAVELNTLDDVLKRIRDSSTTIGVAAAIGALWIGTSFWGAMDTAFCRIYHVDCRGWLEQKRFALVMLLVVTLFLAASVVIPTLEAILVSSASDLPFGLARINGIANVLLLIAALLATFVLFCVIYYFVPKGHVPWHGRLARRAVRHRDDGDRQCRVPLLPRPGLERGRARWDDRVRPHRPGLVLPGQPCDDGRRGHQRPALRAARQGLPRLARKRVAAAGAH